MFDLQSKFQSYSSQVSSAQLPSGDTYTCGISSSLIGGKAYPVLTYVGGSSSDSASNQVCIYLGKAVQVIPSIGIIYAYPVLGLRTVHNGSTDTGEYPSTPDQANAEPALDSSGNFLQVESYPLLNGIKVVSAKVSGSSAEQDLVMFYSNLQDNNTSGNGITAYSRAYTFAPSDVQSTRLRWCIEGGACGTPAAALGANTWKLCAESSDGSRKGQLEIRSSSTGFITKLDLEGCP